MRILILNGPNLNLLGMREPGIYGTETYETLCAMCKEHGQAKGAQVSCYQSNHEGDLIDTIQAANGVYDGIVFNPGAYTHYSYALYDALKAISVPCVEVHISDIHEREDFRRISVIAPACVKQICGMGLKGYLLAMDHFLGEPA